jgi:hypothetical protein
MSKPLSNREKKEIIRNAIEAERARIQASIYACNAKRAENRIKCQELAEAQEYSRIRQLANLKKKMVIIYAVIDGQIVILTIVDPSLMKSIYSFGKKHHITYGSPDYERIYMTASYSPRGKRSERYRYSYTVSTNDGIKFDIHEADGTKRLSFETLIHYESLTGKSFSGVQFDQIWYDPFKGQFDDETAKFRAELVRLINADAEYVKENPELLKNGYVTYFMY